MRIAWLVIGLGLAWSGALAGPKETLSGRKGPRKQAARALAKHGLEATYKTLLADLARHDRRFNQTQAHPELRAVTSLPPLLVAARKDPLALPELAFAAAEQQRAAADLGANLRALAGQLGLELAARQLPRSPAKGSSLEAHLAYLAGRLEAAERERAAAFAGLDAASVEALRAQMVAIFDVLRVTNHLEDLLPEDRKIFDQVIAGLGAAGKVKRARLLQAALELAPLADPGYLAQLAKDLAKAPVAKGLEHPASGGSLVAVKDCAAGPIVVAGRRSNRHAGTGAALILDLGGDDVYDAGCARVAPGAERGLSLVIDLAGDDRYQAGEARFSQACALCGVAMLIDRKGKDRYAGARSAQGVGAFGVGTLVDLEGDDTYAARTLSQGLGLLGVGLLLDRAGDDRLTGAHFCAGVGLPMGVGALIDLAGDDVRDVSGQHARPPEGSWYDTAGQWQGACLGFGMGLRGMDGAVRCFAPGGVGLVVDGGGDDEVKAGEFAVGCGYFYGVGLYVDHAGDDRYHSARYGTGIGVHQAVGCFLELAGDDRYSTEAGPHCGACWDMGVAWFVDLAGKDSYTSKGGLLLGVATITSFAAFLDADGKDSYTLKGGQAAGSAGHAGDTQRRSVSLALFLDTGGDKDTYTLPKALLGGNEQQHLREGKRGAVRTGRGLFSDD